MYLGGELIVPSSYILDESGSLNLTGFIDKV